MNRPSRHELLNKILKAKSILRKKEGFFAHSSKIIGELEQLNITDTQEIWPFIYKLLQEIQPEDYAGSRPPQKSYEKKIEGKDLFAFAWESKILRMRMYMKFVILDDDFYYVSLHQDKRRK